MPYTGPLPEIGETAGEPPDCPDCAGPVRPDVVLFGEVLPEEAWQLSVEAIQAADLFVVVGTSAIVYPAAGLPELALHRGIPVIEVNPERTPLSDRATEDDS